MTFSIAKSLRHARETLTNPPAERWIDRGDPAGEKVCEFVLPLEFCKPFNRVGRAGTANQRWLHKKIKDSAYQTMWAQNGGVAKEPLSGRPHVACVRFSSVASDADSGWTKNPVDRLRVGKNGLGIIKDDKRKDIKLMSWWERAPRGAGFVYVAVFTGEE